MARIVGRYIMLCGLCLLLVGAILPAAAFAHVGTGVRLHAIVGRFFQNPTPNNGAFVNPSTQPEFTQQFPTIFFNPLSTLSTPPTIPCTVPFGVNVNTRPFIDVNINNNCTAIVAQGHQKLAGIGDLFAFEAVFTAKLTVPSAGTLTFNVAGDDGWILSIGPDDGHQPTRISGPLIGAPATSPFKGYTVVGASNKSQSANPYTVKVSVPAAGDYPVELDYNECCNGGLSMTLLTSFS